MHFKDDETSMIFSKTAYNRFNGNDFEVMRTSAYIIKQPNTNNEDTHKDVSSTTTTRKKDNDLRFEKVTITSPTVPDDPPNINKGYGAMAFIAIVSIFVSVLGTLTVVFLCYQWNQRKETAGTILAGDETDNLLKKSGYKSVETMTDGSYFDTVEKNKQMEDMFKSGEAKCCFLCLEQDILQTALFWCLNCSDGLCNECTVGHQEIRNHSLVEIRKLPKNYSSSFGCSLHNQQSLDYFCIDHGELCCSECKQVYHSSCKKTAHIDVISNACRHSQACHDYQTKLRRCELFLMSIVLQVTHNIESIQKECNQIVNKISTLTETEYTRQLNTDLTKIETMCLSTLQHYILKAETLEATTGEMKQLFNIFKTTGSNKLLFLHIHSYRHTLSSKISDIQLLSKNIMHLYVHYHDYEEGNTSVRRIEVLDKDYVIYKSSEQIRNETSLTIPVPASISFQGEFEINNKYTHVGMVVSKNGFLLVCDSVHRVVLMLVENKLEVSIKLLYTPEDIAIIPNNNTAVLTCHTFDLIQFVDLNGRKMIGTKRVDDSATCSVVCTAKYILVGGKMKIIILDHNGTHNRNIEIDCRVRNLSYFDEKIYFTEYGSNKVRCIKMNGDKVLCHQSQYVAAPISAIPNKECHVYVLDRGPIKNHKRGPIAIHKLSTSGQSILLEIKGNVDLQNPQSICFNKDYTKLYVLNNGGSSICTFTI